MFFAKKTTYEWYLCYKIDSLLLTGGGKPQVKEGILL